LEIFHKVQEPWGRRGLVTVSPTGRKKKKKKKGVGNGAPERKEEGKKVFNHKREKREKRTVLQIAEE